MVVQVPEEMVQVVGEKVPVAVPALPKVTTEEEAPCVPLSVAVTVMPAVEPAGAEIALTVETEGAMVLTVKESALEVLAAKLVSAE